MKFTMLWPVEDDGMTAEQVARAAGADLAVELHSQDLTLSAAPEIFVGFRWPHGRPAVFALAEVERVKVKNRQPRGERRPAKCGTDAGYYRHVRALREEPCAGCRAAHAKAEYDRKMRAKARVTG